LRCQPHAPFKGVLGNNEGDLFMLCERINEFKFPLELSHHTLSGRLDGKKYIIYHGQDNYLTESLIISQKYDLVLTGHTHIPLIESQGKTLHCNPGTVSDAANFDIIKSPTLAIYDTRKHQANIIEFLKEVS
jgi:hypothetical protein